jgi:hypothetical protein
VARDQRYVGNAGVPFLKAVKDAEKSFLAGRRNRGADLESAVRLFLEFLQGFEALDFQGPCVTVFGSARFGAGHRYYETGRALGSHLARAGYAVMTGGGPGLMEAVNRGAHEAGGVSLGCNIRLPREQQPNPYLDRFVEFEHFFVRKVMLVKYSCAFVILPGGFGTLDEAFEILTLVQNRKLESFPVVALGMEFWQGMRDFLVNTLLPQGTISADDLAHLKGTDDPAEAVDIIRQTTGACGASGLEPPHDSIP